MNVVVVGASSSIGKPIMKAFTAAGHETIGTSRRELDLANVESIRSFVSKVYDVDALVMLAGILPGKRLEVCDVSDIVQVMTVNFIGPVVLVKEMLPRMRKGAQVLMMSSIAADRGSFDPIYAASKAALEGFVRSMALWSSGIRFNAIAPGLIAGSSMHEAMIPERRTKHAEQTPTQRLTTIDEIAQIVIEVCGPVWANVNGHVFSVDGGRRCA